MRNSVIALMAAAGLCLAGSIACRVGEDSATARSLASAQEKDWLTHKDAQGYSVQYPAGWRIAGDRKSGRVDLHGPQEQHVVVWPVFIPGPLESRAAPAVLRKLAGSAGMNLEWDAPQPAGPAAIRMTGRAADRAAIAVLAWIPSAKGSAGYLYVAAAPLASYRQMEDAFARILGSFRASGAPAKDQGPQLSYVRWHDPRENAFSMEVPAGWKMNGGLFRFASVDTRAAWEAVSPDGEVRITGGDAELPTFTEPNQLLLMAGFREGSWYSPGYGVAMLVRRYIPGAAFAREYVGARAARGCAELAVTANRDLPEAVAAINAVYAQFGGLGVSTRLTAGEAAYTCRKEGQPMRGYCFAGTQHTQVAGMPGGLWRVEYLAGFLAPEQKAPLAQSVLTHIVETIQLNPQWVAAQQNITANTSEIVSRTNLEIGRIIDSSYRYRQAVMDDLSRRRSNVMLGVEDVIDPVTGRQIKVESGSNYYWIDQGGVIVGTDIDTRPNLDFRALIRLP